LLPIQKLPLTQFWQVFIYRAISVALNILAMKVFYPGSLKKFTLRIEPKRALVALGLTAALILPGLNQSGIHHFTPSQWLEGFLFTSWIGIDEESFSRGLVFASLEKYGIAISVAISSLNFGALHLLNVTWGHQSFAYTSGQAVSAMAFGVLMSGFMLYTKSFWPGIFLHGLSDFTLDFQTRAAHNAIVQGGTDWVDVGVQSVMYIAIGTALIAMSGVKLNLPEFKRSLSLLRYFGLFSVKD
jgi:membrane protease YdiL (CAAX protease family)